MARFPIVPLAILVIASILALADDGSAGLVRWVAVFALLTIALSLWFRGRTWEPTLPSAMPHAAPTLSDSKNIAVLLVEVATVERKPLRAQDIELVKDMIQLCVRSGDTVRQIYPDTLAIELRGVTWDLADQIGCRIRDRVQDLILFDDKGLLITIVPKIGGVVAEEGELSRVEDQAKINLAEVKTLDAPAVLLTASA